MDTDQPDDGARCSRRDGRWPAGSWATDSATRAVARPLRDREGHLGARRRGRPRDLAAAAQRGLDDDLAKAHADLQQSVDA